MEQIRPEDIGEMELAFRLAPLGLLVTRKRVICSYNQAFGDMFGFGVSALTGMSIDALYPSYDEFEYTGQRMTQAMRQQDGFYSDERIMRHRTGRVFWCRVTGRAFDKEVPLDGAVWVFEDLSARRAVHAELTRREREIAQFLVAGSSSKVIGRALSISPRTVEAHRSRLMKKLNARSASELIACLIGRD